MIILSLLIVTIAMPLKSYSYVTWGRLGSLILFCSGILSVECSNLVGLANPITGLIESLPLYNSLLQTTLITSIIDSLLIIVGAALLIQTVSLQAIRDLTKGLDWVQRLPSAKHVQSSNPSPIGARGKNSGQVSSISTSNYIIPFLFVFYFFYSFFWEKKRDKIKSQKKERTSHNLAVPQNGERELQVQYGKEKLIFFLCTVLGATILGSSTDSLSLLLSLELQSYSVYVIAAQYKGYEPSEAAGLKYYLLGALSSAIVFMGLGLIYTTTGSTNLKWIFALADSTSNLIALSTNWWGGPNVVSDALDISSIHLGFLLVLIGFIWKIAGAPVHNWSIDVYDAVPSKSASWLSIIPKIAIITLLAEIIRNLPSTPTNQNLGFFEESLNRFNPGLISPLLGGNNLDFISYHVQLLGLLIFVSALSMIIGAIAGLTQPRIKRLLAYSSVLNVGFILLSISIMAYSNQTLGPFGANQTQGLNGQWILYLGQYIITTAGIWLCLLAYANQSNPRLHTKNYEITTTSELQGMSAQKNNDSASLIPSRLLPFFFVFSFFSKKRKSQKKNRQQKNVAYLFKKKGSKENIIWNNNLFLACTMTILLFSTAGIPPMIGFFAKFEVISTALTSGFSYLSLIAIIASLISAVYYIRVIRAIWFTGPIQLVSLGYPSTSLFSPSINWWGGANGANPIPMSKRIINDSLFTSCLEKKAVKSPSSSFAFILSLVTCIVTLYWLQISVVGTWFNLFWV